jgi:hypothetical protein
MPKFGELAETVMNAALEGLRKAEVPRAVVLAKLEEIQVALEQESWGEQEDASPQANAEWLTQHENRLRVSRSGPPMEIDD